jgi:UDP-GlcNAc:undecaprenyl-phosphate/decaprenyl-phosphate GlcNAc-1-phosphate transferase
LFYATHKLIESRKVDHCAFSMLLHIPYLHIPAPAAYWKEALLGIASFIICAAIILLARKVAFFAPQRHATAVQAAHVAPTPRLGGVAIFAALALSTLFSKAVVSEPYKIFIMATSILFFVGLVEDLTGKVTPRQRLLAACLSSLLVIIPLGLWLPRAGIPGLDEVMGYWAVGVPVTLMLTVGIANGFNLIDGVNGLAALTALVAATSLSVIADTAALPGLSHINLMLAAALIGFLALNFPAGRIFLGDAGAYVLGFVLSWLGIGIVINNAEVTPWAILLVLFWPVADTMLAIYRRASRRRSAMAPDRLHVHQLVMRALELCGCRRSVANPLTTLILMPLIVVPAILGVVFWDAPLHAFLSVAFLGTGFALAYRIAFKLVWKYRAALKRVNRANNVARVLR